MENQYGEDITKSYTNSDFSFSLSKGHSASFNPATGLVTVDAASNTNTFADQKIDSLTLTAVHKASGKTTSKNLTVSSAASVKDFTVGKPELKTGETKLAQSNDIILPVTAKDQYGSDVKFSQAGNTTATGLTFVSSATEVSNFEVNADGKVTFDIGVVNKTKDVTITVVNASTGESKAVTFTIYAPAKAETPTLKVTTDKFTTAYNGTSEATSYKVPVSLEDQYGTKLTDDQVVAAYNNNEFTIVSSNPSVLQGTGGSNAFVVTKDAKLGAVVLAEAVAKGEASIIFTVNGSAKTTSTALKVVDPATPAAFAVSPSDKNVAVGGTSVVKASFVDSDNDALTSAAANYKVQYSVAAADASKVSITSNNQTIASQIATGTSIGINPSAAGSTIKVTATLYHSADNTVDAGEAIDTKTFDIVVPAANSALTYDVTDIAKLHATTAGTLTSQYAKQIRVTAKDAAGNTINIPQSKIVSVTSNNPSVATVGVTGGVYKVVGNTVPAAQTQATAELTILVEDNDGSVKTVKKTVTVSNEALSAKSIKAVDDGDATQAVSTFTVADGSTNGTSDELAAGIIVSGTGATGDSNFNFLVEDQFEGKSLAPATYAVTGLKGFILEDNEKVQVTTLGGVSTLQITDGDNPGIASKWSKNAEFTVTAATANGLTNSVKVIAATQSEKVAPTVTTQLAAATALTANATHTLVFSEALDADSKAAVKAAVNAAYTANGTATVSSAWNNAGTTLTVTVVAAAAPNNVVLGSVADIAVTDVIGNTSAALDVQQ